MGDFERCTRCGNVEHDADQCKAKPPSEPPGTLATTDREHGRKWTMTVDAAAVGYRWRVFINAFPEPVAWGWTEAWPEHASQLFEGILRSFAVTPEKSRLVMLAEVLEIAEGIETGRMTSMNTVSEALRTLLPPPHKMSDGMDATVVIEGLPPLEQTSPQVVAPKSKWGVRRNPNAEPARPCGTCEGSKVLDGEICPDCEPGAQPGP